jgi:MFS superfamily sulfate permease-like transporter
MRTDFRPAKRDQPHPLVTVLGLLIVFSLIVTALKTRLLPPPFITIPLAICFAVIFRWVSRWSARAVRHRREKELERLRRTPVLGLYE